MSLENKKYRLTSKVLLVSIIIVAICCSIISAQTQSLNPAAATRLKDLSESMADSYISEIRKLIKDGADVNVINKAEVTPL